MNPPPASWIQGWEVYPPPKKPPGGGGRPVPPIVPRPHRPQPGPFPYEYHVVDLPPPPHDHAFPIPERFGGVRGDDDRGYEIIIEEGSFSGRGEEDDENGRRGRRGRRVVGLRMQQERWERMSRRGSDVGAGEEGRDDDEEVFYMRRRRSRERDREMDPRRGGREEILRVRTERVRRDIRQRGEERNGGGGERARGRGRWRGNGTGDGNGNRGRGRGRGQVYRGERAIARGRVEMRGALQEEPRRRDPGEYLH